MHVVSFQGCVSFSLQELIKYYNIEDVRYSTSFGAKIYKKFPEEHQNILKPLITSM